MDEENLYRPIRISSKRDKLKSAKIRYKGPIQRPDVLEPKEPQKRAPKDPVCDGCQNKDDCKKLCAPLTWIDGNKPLKEKLLRDPIDTYQQSDYNQTLHTLIRSKQKDKRDQIIGIQDIKLRAIAAMLYVEINQTQISTIMRIDRSTLYRICMQHIKSL